MNDTALSAWGAALLRVTLGVAFLAHGLLLKVTTFGVAGTTAYFPSLGYPAALAWLVIGLAALNLFVGFCAGCFVYYRLNRLGVPGFTQSPIERKRQAQG